MRRWFLFLGLALICTGCVRATTAITVRADGTGTIEQVVGATPQAMAMIQGFGAAGAGREGGAGAPPSMFGEAEAKKAAEEMGVRFVSGEPIKTGELEGYKALYAFDDIGKLKMNMKQGAEALAPADGAKSSDPPFGFGFERRGGSSVVTIQIPERPADAAGIMPKMPGATSDAQENAQALAMMKMMMRGLFIDISLSVDGPIIKTNAPYVEGSRVTLMQLDFDKLLEDESGLTKLQQAGDLKTLKNVPGLKIVADPKVTVEFGR